VRIENADIQDNGLIKLGGATIGRVVVRCGVAMLEYKDRNRHRSNDRGDDLVVIPWRQLVNDVELFLGSAVL